MTIDIQVSAARCIASKSCTHEAEGVFVVVDGTARVVDPAAASLDEILSAAECCPTGAITVRDEGRQLT
jgi:uncharacterized Fe-S cluster protein YjdI